MRAVFEPQSDRSLHKFCFYSIIKFVCLTRKSMRYKICFGECAGVSATNAICERGEINVRETQRRKTYRKASFFDLPENRVLCKRCRVPLFRPRLEKQFRSNLHKMCGDFGKTRKRRWTECRRVRIAGSSDAVPELTWRAKPQSGSAGPSRLKICSGLGIGQLAHSCASWRTGAPVNNRSWQ